MMVWFTIEISGIRESGQQMYYKTIVSEKTIDQLMPFILKTVAEPKEEDAS